MKNHIKSRKKLDGKKEEKMQRKIEFWVPIESEKANGKRVDRIRRREKKIKQRQ